MPPGGEYQRAVLITRLVRTYCFVFDNQNYTGSRGLSRKQADFLAEGTKQAVERGEQALISRCLGGAKQPADDFLLIQEGIGPPASPLHDADAGPLRSY